MKFSINIKRLFVFLYVLVVTALLVLPSVKYSFTYVQTTIISIPMFAYVILTTRSKSILKNYIQIITCFSLMALFHFVFNSRGNTSSLLNLMVTFYLCLVPFFMCRMLLDTKDYQLIKWVTIIASAMLALIMFNTFREFADNPTVARLLASGNVGGDEEYAQYLHNSNIGGYGFSYCIGAFIPFITSLIDRVGPKKKLIVILVLVVTFVFCVYTQYTTLIILSVCSLFYVLISQGKLTVKKVLFIFLLFFVIIFIKDIVLFFATNTSLKTVSVRLYDIYNILSGGEAANSRGDLILSAFRLFMDNPIFGVDMNDAIAATVVNSSHSTFFGMLAQGGLIGLFLYYGILSISTRVIKEAVYIKYITPVYVFIFVLSILNPISHPEIFVSSFMVIPLMEFLFTHKETEYGIKKRMVG